MSFLAPENMAIAVCAFIILTLIFAVIVGLVTDSLWGIREQTGLLRQIERNTRPKDGREPTE